MPRTRQRFRAPASSPSWLEWLEKLRGKKAPHRETTSHTEFDSGTIKICQAGSGQTASLLTAIPQDARGSGALALAGGVDRLGAGTRPSAQLMAAFR
jgi:hypothetical protein